ncbi:hypothetical protein G3M48_001669 [Beauveria asiatica]|uniref:Uncharacterized protein n=1 Tax=Beauveria asiatica TaxID=1069075 RepID=A0AAW0RFV9_9HYPO
MWISNHVHRHGRKRDYTGHTGKGKDEPQEADKEGKPLRGPAALVAKRGKDGRRIALRAKGQERDEDAKEADNVQDENHALNLGQQRADDGVDEDGDEHHGPDNQRALPRLPVVLGPGEADEALQHAAGQVRARRRRALPPGHRQPARDVAEKLGAAPRRHHRHPVVLAARRRRHRDQLAQRREDGQVAGPDKQEAVHEAAGTAVGKARREAHERALPGDEDGAAKAENGQEAKVALPIAC